MFAQLIAAMAHHGYLNLEGGQRLVEFIVKQCAVTIDEEVTLLDIFQIHMNTIFPNIFCTGALFYHHHEDIRDLTKI